MQTHKIKSMTQKSDKSMIEKLDKISFREKVEKR